MSDFEAIETREQFEEAVKDRLEQERERVFIPGRCGEQRRHDRKVRKRIEKGKSGNGKRNSLRTCREVVRGNRRRNEERRGSFF